MQSLRVPGTPKPVQAVRLSVDVDTIISVESDHDILQCFVDIGSDMYCEIKRSGY